jgi:MFS family permease
MLGGVSSSFFAVFSLSQLLGLVLSGSLANWIGLRSLFLANAMLLVVLPSVGYLWLREDKPRVRRQVEFASCDSHRRFSDWESLSNSVDVGNPRQLARPEHC